MSRMQCDPDSLKHNTPSHPHDTQHHQHGAYFNSVAVRILVSRPHNATRAREAPDTHAPTNAKLNEAKLLRSETTNALIQHALGTPSVPLPPSL